MTKSKVIFILPRGEAIRNFVYTGIIKKLSKNNEIIILSVLPSKNIVKILEKLNCQIFELKDFKKNYFIRFLRALINISHGFILDSEAAKERRKIRRRDCNSILSILKYHLVHSLGKISANNIGIFTLTSLEKIFTRFNYGYKYYLKLLSDIKPDLVFNGSHVHSENAVNVIHSAKFFKIPTGAFLFSWDNLTSQGRLNPTYDYYFCWNESIKTDLIRIYNNIEEKNIFISGTPQFQFHFDKNNYYSKSYFCEKFGLDPDRPIILYTTGQEKAPVGEEAIVERLADIIKEMKLPSTPQLLVRVYPKDYSNRFQYLKENRDDIFFPSIPWEKNYETPLIEDIKVLVNMIKHCDVGINVASTISLELMFYDKPVINIGYNPPKNYKLKVDVIKYYSYDHYRPLVESGSVVVAKRESEISDLIKESLNYPKKSSTNRLSFIRNFFDDKQLEESSKRFIDNFNQLIENKIR